MIAYASSLIWLNSYVDRWRAHVHMLCILVACINSLNATNRLPYTQEQEINNRKKFTHIYKINVLA